MIGQRNCELMVNEAPRVCPVCLCCALLVTALRTTTALRAKIALVVGKWYTEPGCIANADYAPRSPDVGRAERTHKGPSDK